jgi:alkaline phosphatase
MELERCHLGVSGLFESDHCPFNLERDQQLDPSLTEMTEGAIKILSKNTQGYFLFVEGARIDMGHHEAMVHLALDETVEFSKAIERAVNLTSEEDTLIVVTSDHAPHHVTWWISRTRQRYFWNRWSSK